MSNYFDLLEQRIAANARQYITVRVALRPELLTQLDEARDFLNEERSRVRREGAMVKLNGSTFEQAQEAVEALEEEIRRTCLVVTLLAMTPEDFVIARAGVTKDTPTGEIWKKDLGQAFDHAEDADGNLVEDIHKEQWKRLLEVIPGGELQTWHGKLAKVGDAPDFPTFGKS